MPPAPLFTSRSQILLSPPSHTPKSSLPQPPQAFSRLLPTSLSPQLPSLSRPRVHLSPKPPPEVTQIPSSLPQLSRTFPSIAPFKIPELPRDRGLSTPDTHEKKGSSSKLLLSIPNMLALSPAAADADRLEDDVTCRGRDRSQCSLTHSMLLTRLRRRCPPGKAVRDAELLSHWTPLSRRH